MLRHSVLPSTIEATKMLYPRAHLEQAALSLVQASAHSKTVLVEGTQQQATNQYDSRLDHHDTTCMRPSKASRVHAHLTSSSDILQHELLEASDNVVLKRYRRLTKGAEPLVVCGSDIEPILFKRTEAEDLRLASKAQPYVHFVLFRQDEPLSRVSALLGSILKDTLGEDLANTIVSSISVNFVPESYAGGVTQRMSISVGGEGGGGLAVVGVDGLVQSIMNGINTLPYPIKVTFLGLSKEPCSIPLIGSSSSISGERPESGHEDNARWHPLTNTTGGIWGATTSSTRVLHTLRLRGLSGKANELEDKIHTSLSAPFLNTFSSSLYSSTDSLPSLAYLGDMIASRNYGGALYSLAKEHLAHLGGSGMESNALRLAYAQYKHILGGGPTFQGDAVNALRSGCGLSSSSLLKYLPELAGASTPTDVEVELLSAYIADGNLLTRKVSGGGGRGDRQRRGRGGRDRRGDDEEERGDKDDFETDQAKRLTTLNDRYGRIFTTCVPNSSTTNVALLQARLFLAWNLQAIGILTSIRADPSGVMLANDTPTPGLPRWLGSHHAFQRIPQLHPEVLSPVLSSHCHHNQHSHPTLTPSHTRKVDVVDNAATLGTALLPVGQVPHSCREFTEVSQLTNIGLAAGRFVSGDTRFRCWRPLLMRSDAVDVRVGVLEGDDITIDTSLNRHAIRREMRPSKDVRYVPSLIDERAREMGRTYKRDRGIQSALVSVVLPSGSSLASLLREGFIIRSDVPVMTEGPFSKTALKSVTGNVDRSRKETTANAAHQHVAVEYGRPVLDKDDVLLTGNLLRMGGRRGQSEPPRKRFDE